MGGVGRGRVARPTLATHPGNKQTNRQTDRVPQSNPLTLRTQGSKWSARHPLALTYWGVLGLVRRRLGQA